MFCLIYDDDLLMILNTLALKILESIKKYPLDIKLEKEDFN